MLQQKIRARCVRKLQEFCSAMVVQSLQYHHNVNSNHLNPLAMEQTAHLLGIVISGTLFQDHWFSSCLLAGLGRTGPSLSFMELVKHDRRTWGATPCFSTSAHLGQDTQTASQLHLTARPHQRKCPPWRPEGGYPSESRKCTGDDHL